MSLLSRFNKQVFRIFLQTNGWLLLLALLPAGVYAYTESIWVGIKVFFVFAVVSTVSMLWAFWAVLFPKVSSDS